MNVNDIYKLVQFIIRKNQNGDLTPEEFNRNINFAQSSYVSFLLGNFQTYQLGRPISKVELGQNSVVRQRLSPVIYGDTLTVNSTGFAPYPNDYIQTDSMWSIYGYNRVRYADQDKWFGLYNSVIDPVSTNPIYRLTDVGFQFAPETIGRARLSYVKNPPDIVWGYTLDFNSRPVYNSATSVQPIWDEVSIYDIIVRVLAMVGVNLQAPQVVQYSQMIKEQGQ